MVCSLFKHTMPPKLREYKYAKIYECVCTITGKRYVGSTIYECLKHRIDLHIYDYNRWKKNYNKSYCTSVEVMDGQSYTFNLLQDIPCSDKKQLLREEGKYIQLYKEKYGDLCVNKIISGRTPQEYYNTEQYTIVNKRSRLKHRGKRLREMQEWHKDNIEKSHANTKRYREENGDTIRAYKKSVYAWHKSCDNLSKINIF